MIHAASVSAGPRYAVTKSATSDRQLVVSKAPPRTRPNHIVRDDLVRFDRVIQRVAGDGYRPGDFGQSATKSASSTLVQNLASGFSAIG